MNGPEEDRDVDEGIDPSELADLLADATEDPSQPCTESEGNELSVADGDAVEDMDNNNQLQSEEVFQNEDDNFHEPELISDDEASAISIDDPTAGDAEDVRVERRSSRQVWVPERLNPETGENYYQKLEICHNIMCQSVQGNNMLTYAEDEVAIVARSMVTMSHCYAQQFNLRKGLKDFGNSGVEATQVELGQLHYRNCWRPVQGKKSIVPKKG